MIEIGKVETTFLQRNIDAKNTNGVDVGCGGRKTVSQCIGIDVARDEMTDLSCGKATDAEWICSGDTLPFLNGSVDYVLSRHVLEHMDWEMAVTEWFRVLKIDGIMSIIVPDPMCSHHPGHGLQQQEVAEFCINMGMTLIDALNIRYTETEFYSWGLTLRKNK
jgi:ubiquinone/menaquinone biosynthesis C-methylase UbiE